MRTENQYNPSSQLVWRKKMLLWKLCIDFH